MMTQGGAMSNFFSRIFARGRTDTPGPSAADVDVQTHIETIGRILKEKKPPLGQCFFSLEFSPYELFLDRDITGAFRFIVNEGPKKRFSFTVRCAPDDTETLRSGFQEILEYLSGPRRVAELPRKEYLKGYYFGTG
jgi:hypothetical protein